MPRGGRRAGTPGKAYSNRKDLNGPLPITAASGQQYGARAAQEAAQRAIPMATAPQSTAPAPMAPPPGAGGGAPAPMAPPVLPGGVTPLSAPTERPDEPITAGLPVGAGPGVEALGALGQPSPTGELEEDEREDAKQLMTILPTLEFVAGLPGSSAGLRNYVRRLRSQMPAEQAQMPGVI